MNMRMSSGATLKFFHNTNAFQGIKRWRQRIAGAIVDALVETLAMISSYCCAPSLTSLCNETACNLVETARTKSHMYTQFAR